MIRIDRPIRSPGLAVGETRGCCRCAVGGEGGFRIVAGVGSEPDRIPPNLAATARVAGLKSPAWAIDNDEDAGLFSPAYFCAMRACLLNLIPFSLPFMAKPCSQALGILRPR